MEIVNSLENIIRINPRDIEHLTHLGLLYAKAKEVELTKNTFEKAYQFFPKATLQLRTLYINNLVEAGKVLIKKGELYATKELLTIVQVSSKSEAYETLLAESYYLIGDLDAAIKTIEKGLLLNTENHLSYFRMAKIYHETRNPYKARAAIIETLNIKPGFKPGRELFQQITGTDFDPSKHLK